MPRFTIDSGYEVGDRSLGINSIKLNPGKPFQWASGYFMPIYNDNRMLLGCYDDRMLVGRAVYTEAKDLKNNDFEIVAGTSTAGIAPAATMAFRYSETPLVIIENNSLFYFDKDMVDKSLTEARDKAKGSDVIASTCPYGIPYGVELANQLELPFVYVRQKQKGHGLKQQIEGILNEDQNVFLVDYHGGESYHDNAVNAVKEKGGNVTGSVSENIESKIACDSVEGKKILVIEDLISTGGSSVKEVIVYREKGANVVGCVSIFNYELEKALEQFKEVNCEVRSALTYGKLLEIAKEKNYIDEKAEKLLKEWRQNPFGWGEKNGFPPVKK